ncbi:MULTISPECIES: CidA/LrgA family protein [Vibrio]|uniref:CidA/LrgA family protein n=1 Tax=Vibrio TaxID=662 RepID=UPI000D0A8E3D|nr:MULTISPECIES: CidA/LrgA family protein [Vibrio]NAW69264.1 CidA/LrgA family protein [Vibrio sp. V28_P6S34P95]NAX05211.1 CidA/LrgA family protein [Vibrio sp. V30_P3S12P165]NAX35423.1 CidA/LrgA family protein [Vibrio sp. V29_P1S30P107]NAX37087.1 CidA/LrgA family protein [Vibrio sp. V27_P1S3P104]NAX40540.1 CidA/LrgA family protein [Vibrio sp. V26_P1S5P106]
MKTINHYLKLTAQYLVSMGLIFLCLWAGITLQHWLGIAIPGSIIGLLILFALLASGLVPVDWVRPSAHLFIRYMILLFVPISVGLMVHFDVLINNLWPILASAIGGSVIVLVSLGFVLDRSLKKGEK